MQAILRHNEGLSSDDEMPGQDMAGLSKVPYQPVLRIWDVYPGSEFFPSRIRIKKFKYFNPKNCFPDPGVNKAPDPHHCY